MSNTPAPLPLLALRGVSKSFGAFAALRDCNLLVSPGEISGVIGPNGSGKTTLMNVIAGVLRADTGTITYDGRDITPLALHERALAGMMRTFQISRELRSLTVFENMLVAAPEQRGERIVQLLLHRAAVRAQQARIAESARQLLTRVGLWALADDPAVTLSGGQKKLLELARAMMGRPRLVLLDEPAAGVSPPMVRRLAEMVRGFRDEGATFVLVEHDMELVAELCTTVHVLAEGSNLKSGSFAEVTADPGVRTAYLGATA